MSAPTTAAPGLLNKQIHESTRAVGAAKGERANESTVSCTRQGMGASARDPPQTP
jgi:hypothetical protein